MVVPGAYTHIAMANKARVRPNMEAFNIPEPAIVACAKWLKYCELGAVSPDLPYLDFNPAKRATATGWADSMHYHDTDGVIRHTVTVLRSDQWTATQKEKGLAWLLGYTAHVVMDNVIHPVIELKVGPYQGNETAHRNCEMHQDVATYATLNLGISTSEHLDSGIATCREADGRFDATIEQLWKEALQVVYPQQFQQATPDPAGWHGWFKTVVDGADGGNRLFAIARHIVPNLGLVYPDHGDPEFLENLAVPSGGTMKFSEVFAKAQRHVSEVWRVVARGALGVDEEYGNVLKNCNLDTGKDATGKTWFW
jgi:hypothetical protein